MRPSPIVTALLLAAVLLLAATSVRAEQVGTRPVPPETIADTVLRDISARIVLTPDERTAIRPILVEQARKRQALLRDRPTGMRALPKALSALDREADVRLAAVLPPDKLAALQQYRAERRQEMRAQLAARRAQD